MTVPNYSNTRISPEEQTEIEAKLLRRLLTHLDENKDVQNIDLMNLAGFCRNCLSKWLDEEATARGKPLGKEASREVIYGMKYSEWKEKYQTDASEAAQSAFEERASRT